MKRITACFIVVMLMLTCCFNMFVYAESENPIIIVPGYMGSKLYADSELDERVFGEYGTATELMAVPEGEYFVKEPVNLQKAAEYGAGNKYKALCNALTLAYPKRKVFFFSYDFTKGTKNAAAVKRAITKVDKPFPFVTPKVCVLSCEKVIQYLLLHLLYPFRT